MEAGVRTWSLGVPSGLSPTRRWPLSKSWIEIGLHDGAGKNGSRGRALRRFRWSWPDESPENAKTGARIARTLQVPNALGVALANRGLDVSRAKEIAGRSLLECTETIGEPDRIEEAAEQILSFARTGAVGILCDFDVDGATAQAILVETLRAVLPLGARDPVVVVPHRNTEGFGPNPRCLNFLSEKGVSCVVVLDCGTSAGKLLDTFHRSFQVLPIVVDHHPPDHEHPPSAGILVNPWVSRSPDPGEQGTLCAAGLAWFLARAMLRKAGLTPAGTVALRKRITLLAALGTSCDMMRIDTPFNRALVRTGVAILGEGRAVPPGLAAVAAVAGVSDKPTSQDFGWRIGPRLNAGSRMGKSTLAAHCLRESNARTAGVLAKQLQDLNRQRVELGERARDELHSSVRPESLAAGPVNLHRVTEATPGTVGLVASYLVKRYGWPAVAVVEREDGLLAGSGRSALGFDLGAAVSAARREGILVSGGGHAAACGLTLEPSRLKDLGDFLHSRFESMEPRDGRPPEPTHRIDAELGSEDLSGKQLLSLAESLERLEPWGQGLQAPLFGIRGCALASSKTTPKGHVFLRLAAHDAKTEAVWWRAPADWYQLAGLDRTEPRGSSSGSQVRVDLACRIELDEWGGQRRGRLVIRDLRAPAG